jgi:biotin carboxyl carrier protein
MKFELQLEGTGGKTRRVVGLEREGGGYRVTLEGRLADANVVQIGPNTISVLLNGLSFEVHVLSERDGRLKLQVGPDEFYAVVEDPRSWSGRRHGALEAEGRQKIVAPMPGKVIRILIKVGDPVEAKQGIAVVEAMKMQNEIHSPKSGRIERVLVKEGQNVSAGEILAWVE